MLIIVSKKSPADKNYKRDSAIYDSRKKRREEDNYFPLVGLNLGKKGTQETHLVTSTLALLTYGAPPHTHTLANTCCNFLRLLYYKDLQATQIDAYATSQMSVHMGVLYQDGKPLFSAYGNVRVSVMLSCLGPKPLQGLLVLARLNKYGLVTLTILERKVKKGYYIDECSNQSIMVTTFNLSDVFLKFGWTQEQGNTAGIMHHNPLSFASSPSR